MLSKNGIGLIMFFLTMIGADVAETDVTTTINTIVQVGSALLLVWNQVGRSDTKWFIFKQ